MSPSKARLQTSPSARHDFNSDVYYKNKLEFSLESGYLPINIPFAFDVFVGGDYAQNPLHYTLVPIFPSLRWQMGGVHGPGILRGNTDLTATVSATFIPRGPENHYAAFDLGFRRNFVQPNWRVAPYFEVRVGAGIIDAQGLHGKCQRPRAGLHLHSYEMALPLRYNFNGRYSMALGATYFHVSNAYLSEPKYDDNGINVWGPWIGVNMH